MKAKEFLCQIKKLDKMIENKLQEEARWRDMATSLGTFSAEERVQTSGNKQKMADAICDMLDTKDEVKRLIDRRNGIISVIEELDLTQYELLYKVYVEHMSLEEAGDALYKGYSWAATVHGRALKEVQGIIDRMAL